MEDNMQMIYDFINRFEDFTPEDRKMGFQKVYRPSWHPFPVQFWFNPPLNGGNMSSPTPSSTIALDGNGEICVQDFYSGAFYRLSECLGHSADNLAVAIEDYLRQGAL